MVEFSLVFLLFLVMMAGLVEIGRSIWVYNSVTFAAKQGARYAMVHGSRNPIPQGGATVEQYTKAEAIGLRPASVQASVSCSPDNTAGSQVTVTATHELDFIVGRLLGVGPSITLQGSSTKTVLN